MIELVVGLPGQGKSLMAARTVLQLLERNERWFERSGIRRRIASNMPISEDLQKKWPGRIVFWKSLEEVVKMSDVDVIFDEVANKLDARNWINLPDNVKEWLRHHDKDGTEIYANTQNYEAVDVSFRRLTNRLFVVTKLLGSPRPAATRPPRRPWGVILYRQHDPKLYSFNQDTSTGGKRVRSAVGFPGWFFIHRALVDIYDTRFKILGDNETTLRHIVKVCHTCHAEKIIHV